MRRRLAALSVALAVPAAAGSLREIDPIVGTTPGPDTAVVSAVPTALVERVVRQLADAWNGPALDSLLAADFPERARLLDALQRLPLDARLRVLSVGPVHTLSQQALPDGRVSEVMVRVRGQVEFVAADGSLQRLPTEQEWTVRVAQRVP